MTDTPAVVQPEPVALPEVLTLRDVLRANEGLEGFVRLRQPDWALADFYFRVFVTDGKLGPYADLFSRTEQAAVGLPTPQSLQTINWDLDVPRFVPYTGAPDKADAEAPGMKRVPARG